MTLQRLADSYQKSGELESLVAIRQEEDRFKQDGDIPIDSAAGAPALLITLQSKTREVLAGAKRTAAQSVIDLTDKYVAYLDRLKRSLTTEGKLEEALAVRDEIENVKKSPAYTSAQFELAALDAATPEVDEDDQATARTSPRPVHLSPHRLAPRSDGYIFVFESTAGLNPVSDRPRSGRSKAELVPEDGAEIGADRLIRINKGRVRTKGIDDQLLSSCRESNELTVETVLSVDNLNNGGPARILTFSIDSGYRNFTLGQQREWLILRLNTASGERGSVKERTLCKLEADRPYHVLVTYRDGELACYLNGTAAFETDEITGGFSDWQEHHFLMGDEHNGGRQWTGGILEGIAVSCRFTPPTEARRLYERARRKSVHRGRL